MLITGQNRTWQPNDDAIMTDRVRRYGLIGGAVLEIVGAAATRAWRIGYGAEDDSTKMGLPNDQEVIQA